MTRADGRLDLVVVGGGIAGAAMALVMARSGARVAVLERQIVYRDHVRGEFMQPWGVAEAQRLNLCDVFEDAGGLSVRFNVGYDEIRSPEAAERAPHDVSKLLPDVPGGLCADILARACALSAAAEAAGVEVLRGVTNVQVACGARPEVRFDLGGKQQRLARTLVIGADGRASGADQSLPSSRISLSTRTSRMASDSPSPMTGSLYPAASPINATPSERVSVHESSPPSVAHGPTAVPAAMVSAWGTDLSR